MKYTIYCPFFLILGFRAKVKVTVAIFRKSKNHCHRSSAFMYGLVYILYHTNVQYDIILDKFEFECSRAKVKVKVAIFRKKNIVIALAPAFMDQF